MEGDMINVRIEALDIEEEKLKLSMKPSIADVGSDWYSGLISSIYRHGVRGVVVALVLRNGDYETGFLPISQMSKDFATDFNTRALVIGQEVKVKLLSFQSGNITLSMASRKSPSRSHPPDVFAKIPHDKWILGCLARVERAGLFITLQLDGVQADALLRRANVAWGPSCDMTVRGWNAAVITCHKSKHCFCWGWFEMMHIVSDHQGYWKNE